MQVFAEDSGSYFCNENGVDYHACATAAHRLSRTFRKNISIKCKNGTLLPFLSFLHEMYIFYVFS